LRRNGAISFVSSGKLYYGLGADGTTYFKDIWEYDPTTGVWTQKADYAGDARSSATTFVLGDDAYVGFGRSKSYSSHKDLWKYNSASNAWTASVSYPNNNSVDGSGVFVSDGKAYLIGGYLNSTSTTNELWRFDGTTWVQLTSLPGETRKDPITFTLSGKAYVGAGVKVSAGGSTTLGAKDFWEYTISSDTWRQLNDLPAEMIVDSRSFAVTGTNSAIIFSSPNGSVTATGLQTRMYSPALDKWSSFGKTLHMDYMSNYFTLAQDPTTGFAYSVVYHYTFGVKLWRYDYLLNGPNLVEANLSAPNVAKLKWRKISPQADSVVIYRSEVPNVQGARMSVVKTSDTTATNSVSNGKTYYYSIRAYSNAGQFKTSAERMLVVDNPPSAPINLVGEMIDDKVVLTWQPADGAIATSYTIERAVNSDTNFQSIGTSNTLDFTTSELPGSRLSYRVKAVNGSGDSPYSNVVLMLITAIEEKPDALRIYPNPTTDYITVEIEGNNAPMTIQILDNSGRPVYNKVVNTTTRVDVAHYPAGIYFVNLAGSKTALNKYIKIIKK
jgi:hypothetical protein